LAGALGCAILAHQTVIAKTSQNVEKSARRFSFEVDNMNFRTAGHECDICPNHCEIMLAYSDDTLLNAWGNRCQKWETKTLVNL